MPILILKFAFLQPFFLILPIDRMSQPRYTPSY
jgi:hypothetical protein